MAKKFVLVDAQDDKKLELHIAFAGNDNEDQIVCSLTEKQVKEMYEYYSIKRIGIEFDADVTRHILNR